MTERPIKLEEIQSKFYEFMQQFTGVDNYILLLRGPEGVAAVIKNGFIQDAVNILAKGMQLILNGSQIQAQQQAQKDSIMEAIEDVIAPESSEENVPN